MRITPGRYVLLFSIAAAVAHISSPEAAGRLQTPDTFCIDHVTVIDPAAGTRTPDQRVVIAGERIASVTKSTGTTEPACSNPFSGAGRYLIPGLWDMHVHGTRHVSTYPIYLANGVTGVREMFGPQDANAFRANLVRQGVDAPRIYLASPVMDGHPAIWPGSIEVTTVDEARKAVRTQRARGADFIKVYERLPRDAYFAIMTEAKREGIPVAGHVPGSVTPWEAVAAGQVTIEHNTQVGMACSSDETRLRQKPVRSYSDAISLMVEASHSFDPAKCQLFYAALKRNGTWMVPTFVAKRADAMKKDPGFVADERLRYFEPDVRAMLAPDPASPAEAGWANADAANAKELLAFDQRIVGEMFRRGVRILAGTDTMNPYAFPGFSLHDELRLLVDAGLSNLAALQAATSSAVEMMGKSRDYGSVAPGKMADLVLLEADPLEDIHNTTRIVTVVLGGKVFDRQALDNMLKTAAGGR